MGAGCSASGEPEGLPEEAGMRSDLHFTEVIRCGGESERKPDWKRRELGKGLRITNGTEAAGDRN